MTLGPALIALAFLERVQNWFTNIMNVYGRVPMFYYIIHFFIVWVYRYLSLFNLHPFFAFAYLLVLVLQFLRAGSGGSLTLYS